MHFAQRNLLTGMFYLLWWSIFQPSKLRDLLARHHPELTIHTGVTRQLWLARRSGPVRALLAQQIGVWLVMGLISFGLMVAVRLFTSPTPDLAGSQLIFEAIFGVIGTVAVAVTLSAVGGIALGVTGSAVGGVLLGLSLGLSFGLAGGSTAGVALGLAGGIILGMVGSTFDHLRRPTMVLSSWAYWGRAMVGFIFTALSIGLFGLVLLPLISIVGSVPINLTIQTLLGALLGGLVSLLILASMAIGMRFEIGNLDRIRLRWHALDVIIIGLVGGVAGGFVIGAPVGVAGAVSLIVLWGVLVGAGGGLAMHAGNGISATLAAAGLTWSLVAGPNDLFATPALLAVGTTLLVGLFSYVRLPLCMIEVPLTRWQYFQLLRRPAQVFELLRRTPAYWDDLVFYPLPALDQFLLTALRVDRDAGLEAVSYLAHSYRQGWAATRAQLAFAAETLAAAATPALIATAPADLEWLADEVMTDLGQGTREVVPRLLAIAGGVGTTLNADNAYSRRLGFREALDGLDTLQRRLPSLGPKAVARWQPVIDRWQQVLLNELETVTSAAVSTPTENPYQPGNPLQLSRRALFQGRQKLRDAVVNALLERQRPTLVLYGPRRMGKTSFLLQLPALLPGNTLPVFLDLQRPTVTENTAAFFYAISRAISRDARPYRLSIDAPPRPTFSDSPFEAFAAWLEDVALPALRDFNLLLTFDEFEKLGEALQSGRLDTRVFDELRYLIQHQQQMALLFAGVQSLDELGPDWSSYFINVKPLTIDYLQPDEAETLIRRPDPTVEFNLIYPDEVVTGILSQTCCHPYLLQLVCSAIVDESNAQNTLQVAPPLFERALVRALDQGEPYFRNIWDEMAGPDGQASLVKIAEAEATPLPTSPALGRLMRRRVITQTNGHYQVEVPLVRRWIIERRPR